MQASIQARKRLDKIWYLRGLNATESVGSKMLTSRKRQMGDLTASPGSPRSRAQEVENGGRSAKGQRILWSEVENIDKSGTPLRKREMEILPLKKRGKNICAGSTLSRSTSRLRGFPPGTLSLRAYPTLTSFFFCGGRQDLLWFLPLGRGSNGTVRTPWPLGSCEK